MVSTDPEYGVYERLAVLETELAAIKDARRRTYDDPPKTEASFVKGIPDRILVYILIALNAIGMGPEVLANIINGLGK